MIFLIYIILSAVIAYLIGSISPAIIIMKRYSGKDIRTLGSKNAGATNVYRSAGKKTAAMVLAADLMKGAVAVLLAKALVSGFNAPQECIFVSGFFVQLGHCFPLYYKFKGGKGVAAAAGSALIIMPFTAIILILTFVLISLTTKTVSLASGICAAIYPLAAYFSVISHKFSHFVFAASCSALIIIMHTKNFARLVNGNELKVK